FRLIVIVALTNVGSMIASILFPVVILPLIGGPFDSVGAVTAAMQRGARNSAELVWRVLA
ncbi:MAG: conjugal transfer protein TraB, partial [Halodesulfurarchaeum sp.]